jgi:hypothetical protein
MPAAEASSSWASGHETGGQLPTKQPWGDSGAPLPRSLCSLLQGCQKETGNIRAFIKNVLDPSMYITHLLKSPGLIIADGKVDHLLELRGHEIGVDQRLH